MIEVEVFGAGEALSAADVRRLCLLTAARAGVEHGHLAVEFVDARRIAALNEAHRSRPVPTDVLSFPVDGVEPLAGVQSIDGDDTAPARRADASPRELGDVLICPEHAADLREAVVHGVLHLLGMDHETDGGEMLALQRAVLAGEDG
jgi:probable rRNA maturation factor